MYHFYSETTLNFLSKYKVWATDLLCNTGNYYNFRLIVIDDENKLGICVNSNGKFVIGVNRLYIDLCNEEQTKELLVHELAHLIQTKREGKTSHDKNFRAICTELGYPNAGSAKSNIEKEIKKQTKEQNKISDKVKKLKALSKSPNEHEAQLALEKAQDLIKEHNIAENVDRKYVYEYRISAKRVTKYMRFKMILLKEYGVFTIIDKTTNTINISGERQNIEIAVYVWDYLDQYCERSWKREFKKNGWSGRVAKARYFEGVIIGYIKTLKEKNTKENQANSTDVTIVDQVKKAENLTMKLVHSKAKISKTKNSRTQNHSSFGNGVKNGSKMKINKGVGQDQKKLSA